MANQHKLGRATSCIRISAAVYVIAGLALFALLISDDKSGLGFPFAVGMLLFCLALACGIEFVVYGLRRRKFWAWVAGLCIFGFYVPTLFLPLGVIGLWGLLDSGSRAEFAIGNSSAAHSDARNSPADRESES